MEKCQQTHAKSPQIRTSQGKRVRSATTPSRKKSTRGGGTNKGLKTEDISWKQGVSVDQGTFQILVQ
jgi:hypothetical protein